MNITFGKWLPDLAPEVNGLETCLNVVPINGRYLPFYGPSSVDDTTITDAKGLFTCKDSAGSSKTFVGTASNIYRKDATLTEVSKIGGYSLLADGVWDWTVYGDTVIMATPSITPQKLANFAAGTNFVDLGGSPPIASCCEMYHDHLFLGNIANYPRRVYRSAKGNIDLWTVSSDTGCGFYDIPAWGERLIALMPMADVLLAYFDNSIWAIQDVGAPYWFSYHKIHEGIGPGSIGCLVKADINRHYFMAKDDIYEVSNLQVRPIGLGVRQTVLNTSVYWDQVYKISSVADPLRKLIFWLYPTVVADDTRILVYNYETEQFSQISTSLQWLGQVSTSPSYTIDGLDSFGITIDQLSGRAFDESFWTNNVLGVGCVGTTLSIFGGSPLASTILTGRTDLDEQQMITKVEPTISQCNAAVTASVINQFKPNQEPTIKTATMKSDGLIDLRANVKRFKLQLNVDGLHNGIIGAKIKGVA